MRLLKAPSAARTRMAAKRSLSGPWVPRRQEMRFQADARRLPTGFSADIRSSAARSASEDARGLCVAGAAVSKGGFLPNDQSSEKPSGEVGPLGHAVDHHRMNPRNAALREYLELAAESPVTHEPREGTLHNPALQQHDEAAPPREPRDDLELQALLVRGLVFQHSREASGGIDRGQRRKPLLIQGGQERIRSIAALHVGHMDRYGPNQSEGVVTRCRLRPVIFFSALQPQHPPFRGTRTDWMSTIVAEGIGSRPT